MHLGSAGEVNMYVAIVSSIYSCLEFTNGDSMSSFSSCDGEASQFVYFRGQRNRKLIYTVIVLHC